MTLQNPSHPQVATVSMVRAPFEGAGRAMGSVFATLLRRYQEARAIERLMAMDASRLKDLGISRSEVELVVRFGR